MIVELTPVDLISKQPTTSVDQCFRILWFKRSSPLSYDSTAILKHDSEATVVIGILKMSLAMLDKEGNRFLFIFHQLKMSKSMV